MKKTTSNWAEQVLDGEDVRDVLERKMAYDGAFSPEKLQKGEKYMKSRLTIAFSKQRKAKVIKIGNSKEYTFTDPITFTIDPTLVARAMGLPKNDIERLPYVYKFIADQIKPFGVK